MNESRDVVTFLGTAGARFVVARQLLASGGAWLDLCGTRIVLDPGPGCLVRAISRGLDPGKLDAIVLSHRHLDHSGDMSIMIEAMTGGGTKKRGVVFAPGDALDEDPVIFSYLRPYPREIRLLVEGGRYSVNGVSFVTPIRHNHGVETYGFVFDTPRHTFSWITDTRYFEGLAGWYAADVVIINVVRLGPGAPIDHLSLPEAGEIIRALKPRAAVLTHFGMTMLRAKPEFVAERLSDETGVAVIAARDGMELDLNLVEKQ